MRSRARAARRGFASTRGVAWVDPVRECGDAGERYRGLPVRALDDAGGVVADREPGPSPLESPRVRRPRSLDPGPGGEARGSPAGGRLPSCRGRPRPPSSPLRRNAPQSGDLPCRPRAEPGGPDHLPVQLPRGAGERRDPRRGAGRGGRRRRGGAVGAGAGAREAPHPRRLLVRLALLLRPRDDRSHGRGLRRDRPPGQDLALRRHRDPRATARRGSRDGR